MFASPNAGADSEYGDSAPSVQVELRDVMIKVAASMGQIKAVQFKGRP